MILLVKNTSWLFKSKLVQNQKPFYLALLIHHLTFSIRYMKLILCGTGYYRLQSRKKKKLNIKSGILTHTYILLQKSYKWTVEHLIENEKLVHLNYMDIVLGFPCGSPTHLWMIYIFYLGPGRCLHILNQTQNMLLLPYSCLSMCLRHTQKQRIFLRLQQKLYETSLVTMSKNTKKKKLKIISFINGRT